MQQSRKRLEENNYNVGPKNKNLLREVFGSGLNAKEKALMYVKKSREKVLDIDPEWPKPWKDFLNALVQEDPLSARLGEAWARQNGKQDIVNQIDIQKPYPWEKNKYWKKERIDQALIQIASRNRQQLIWEGRDDIINLSGGNILAFLSLCQQIWEVWMRDTKDIVQDQSLPKFDEVIQTLGILEASAKWYEEVSSVKGGGSRKLFITYLGTKFYRVLTQDQKMSYPGHNGFSLVEADFISYNHINKFLTEASDFGDLQERQHTTKNSSGEKRIKWYLNPIFSPRFKIPSIRTKEPMYVSIKSFEDWMVEADIISHDDMKTTVYKHKPKTKKPSKADPNQGEIIF